MRKAFRIEGDLCANCAEKIKAAVERLDGVNSVSVNAMTLKFTLDADDAMFDDVVKKSVKIFEDIEPDAELVL